MGEGFPPVNVIGAWYSGTMNDALPELSEQPVITGRPAEVDGFRLIPEVLDLNGRARVRVTAPDMEDFIVPSEFLTALGSRAGSLHSDILRTLDDARRQFGDVGSFGLESALSNRWVPAGGTVEQDMTPVLSWVTPRDYNGEKTGWQIYLAGAKEAPVGFARWDDRPALENLVAMMSDPESMLTIAAIMNPGPVAKLTGRMAAATLRSARQLPGIDLKKVRAILSAANISNTIDAEGGGNRWTQARLRLLTIVSGSKSVPVAVAIQPPYVDMRELLEPEERQLSYADRMQLMEARRDALTEPWITKTREAMTAGGWRVLDLPTPRAMWGRPSQVLWVTRIDPETWSGIAAAAAARAETTEMSRGAVL